MPDSDFFQRAGFERPAELAAASVLARVVEHRPGIAGSVLLHALLALAIVMQLRAWNYVPPLPAIPVDLVYLDDTAPSAKPAQAAPPPQRRASVRPERPRAIPAPRETPQQRLASVAPPTGIVPPQAEPKPDALQSKLEQLAMLRQPGTDSRLAAGAGEGGGTGGSGRGPSGAYSVKDYVRAQVERRWNLDLAELGKRDVTIPIRVVLHRDGTITDVEILDDGRFRGDPALRSIAISARNAVLLSSPLSLPAGNYDSVMEMTLNLNPRDTLR